MPTQPTSPAPPGDAPPPAHAATSKTTPLKVNSQGKDHFTTKKIDAETLKVEMAEELAGQWVGPMPVRDFIDTFLKLPKDVLDSMPKFEPDFFNSLAVQKHETDMYDPFIAKMETTDALEGFKLSNTSSSSDYDTVTEMKNKPDVSCYPEDLDIAAGVTRFEDIELILEFKTQETPADPFNDDAKRNSGIIHPFEPKSNLVDTHSLREKCRGQIASYARIWCTRQHRTHCFILWLGDPHARIMRIDRSGGIVSAKFDYRKNSNLLLEFFWRFARSDRKARGHDITVSKATPAESEKAKEALAEWTPSSVRSVFKLEVPDGKETRSLFVWKPLADPYSVTGRATRGYPAWDPKGKNGEGAVVFVKDSWRSCEEGLEKESDIIEELNKADCCNVPKLICGDDIPNHATVTKKFVKASWNVGGEAEHIVDRVHHRFAQDFVGYHLETFKSSRELIQAIYDAILAHKDAYEKCGILHRDISGGNVLLKKGGGGILNDWDLAKRINKGQKARQPYRSGTWQFMSAAILITPDKENTVQDDTESIFWLVLYFTLRYMKHNRLPGLKKLMENIFEQEYQPSPDASPSGGFHKRHVFISRDYIGTDFTVEGNEPLAYLINALIIHWDEWYSTHLAIEKKIGSTATLLKISPAAAAEKHPFDPRNLAMFTYGATLEVFETALKMPNWPMGDGAVDHLPITRVLVRKLEIILDDSEDINPAKANSEEILRGGVSVTRPMKKPKTSQRLKDDDEYKPTSSASTSVIPIDLGIRESARNKGKPRKNYDDGSDHEKEQNPDAN